MHILVSTGRCLNPLQNYGGWVHMLESTERYATNAVSINGPCLANHVFANMLKIYPDHSTNQEHPGQ